MARMDAPGALAEGRWGEARRGFEQSIEELETADAYLGLANALWWLGENEPSVAACTRAYALHRREGDVTGMVQSAVWLAITYKANFSNSVAANGWLNRAERLLAGREPDSLHAWIWLARAYRSLDLRAALDLTERALAIARAAGDVDLELGSIAQIGLIKVGMGEASNGFALIDEAMAGVLGGERSSLDTVAYVCCDMLNACDLATDMDRATQWVKVADDFINHYGCPFLYAECRTVYGSVLIASGRWSDAERELTNAVDMTEGVCPSLHSRALARMAELRIRQGRLEDADAMLSAVDESVPTPTDALSRAALLLARGDASGAQAVLHRCVPKLRKHRMGAAAGLELLVDSLLAAGDLPAAANAARRLSGLVDVDQPNDRVAAASLTARGRVALADGRRDTARDELERALTLWCGLDLPFEAACTRADLARSVAPDDPAAAVAHGRRALTAFDALGARIEADRVAAFLRTLGVVPRIGAKGLGTLTAREREVLTLLGSGLSNPEIAARLHVSRKTAAHHVSSVLSKLGLRNRAEAAAYAAHART